MFNRRSIVILLVASGLAVAASARAASGPVVITNQPQNITICECRDATFTVGVDGTPPFAFQWYGFDASSGGRTAIYGATQQSYTMPRIQIADDGSQFSVVVTNAFGSITSAWATLHVADCIAPPRLLSATGQGDPTKILLTFDVTCGLDPASAQEPLNYMLTGGINVTVASLGPGNTVLLTTDAALADGATYTVTVDGVSDISGNTIQPDSRASFNAWIFTPGFLRMDVFAQQPGVVTCGPGCDPNYPNNPRERYYLTHADSRDAYPDDSHEHYYARLWGFFVPDRTTNYTFYLRSDDGSRLLLGADETPASKVLLVEEAGCCNPFSARASSPRSLVAGRRYFLELIYFEYFGGDYGQASIDATNPIPANLLGIYTDPQRRLDMRRSTSVVTLSWPTGGTLQEATNLPAQWMDRSNAANPFIISNGPTRFFRVRFEP